MTENPEGTADTLAFGEALTELETIVSRLESGQLELEDSLTQYERGVALLKSLQARLVEANQRVTMLIGELEAESDSAESDV